MRSDRAERRAIAALRWLLLVGSVAGVLTGILTVIDPGTPAPAEAPPPHGAAPMAIARAAAPLSTVTAVPPSGTAADIGHGLEGRENCQACHGARQMAPMPADHTGYAYSGCRTCHAQVVPAPDMAHRLEGHEPCSQCHGGADTLVVLAASHRWRNDLTCLGCHNYAGKTPVAITHSISDARAACVQCHADGQMAPLPEDHRRRTDAMCLACHAPAKSPAPALAHAAQDHEACSACHGERGIVRLPPSHKDRRDLMCTVCHDSITAAPGAPHALADKAVCSACHTKAVLGALPPSHARRTDAMCVLCHTTAAKMPGTIPHALDKRQDCTICHRPADRS